MNNSENCEVSDFSNLQSLEKIQKLIRELSKRFANCELRMAISNPVSMTHSDLLY